MTAAFRHVFINYPAAQLPADLREDLSEGAAVTITIEPAGGFRSGQKITEKRFVFRDGLAVLVGERELQCP